MPLPSSLPQESEEDKVALLADVDLAAVTEDQLHSAYLECPVLQQVLKHLRDGWPRNGKGLNLALLPSYGIQTELAEVGGT